MKDIFDQVEECGFVATKDSSEVYKVLYVDRQRDFILTDGKEILRLGDGCFWVDRKAFGITESVYFYPHKQKQKYYQWVLIDDTNKAFISTSLYEPSEIRIMGGFGYFTKERQPNIPNSSGLTGTWIPILETEKEA